MTATTSTDNLSHLSTEDATTQISAFLKEHGEIEMILPVVIGVFVTSRFQLRGANALLVNLLIASLGRQLFIQLKKEQPSAVIEGNNSNNSNSTGEEMGASESDLQGYTIAHAVPGRVRLKMPQLAIDADFARRLKQALDADEYVNRVRINPPAASVAINYHNQGLSDWELGLRLMNIVNIVRQENQVPQPISN
ncbi:MAG: HMA2 domain-containing protein [Prochloraceae cyanobacterium]